jgi:hypothetical protein
MNGCLVNLIQCEDGSYINPAFYGHFFVYAEPRTVDGRSFIDYSIGANPQSHISVTIMSEFKTKEEAQKKLDEMLKSLNVNIIEISSRILPHECGR